MHDPMLALSLPLRQALCALISHGGVRGALPDLERLGLVMYDGARRVWAPTIRGRRMWEGSGT